MSNNTLKKPVMLPASSGYHPQQNNFGQPLVPNSSEGQTMQNPSVSVQNPQNVYFIYGDPTIPVVASAPSQQDVPNYEQRFQILENRITKAVEKFEQMLKAQEEKAKVQRFSFGANVFRPATADGFSTQNRVSLFGQQPQNAFSFGSRSFERPFWFGSNDNNQSQNSFAKAKGLFEQHSSSQHTGMLDHKPQCPMKIQNPNITKLINNHKENNLDIIDGITKPSGCFSLRDMSDDEEN
jgi:hypothetical protein